MEWKGRTQCTFMKSVLLVATWCSYLIKQNLSDSITFAVINTSAHPNKLCTRTDWNWCESCDHRWATYRIQLYVNRQVYQPHSFHCPRLSTSFWFPISVYRSQLTLSSLITIKKNCKHRDISLRWNSGVKLKHGHK